MNYGDLVNQVLRLIDEYSKNGTALATAKTADYRLKIPDAVNEILMDLASSTGKLPKEWTIIHKPEYTGTTYETATISNHIPGTDDLAATLTGARSYFVEVSGNYNVVLEESISGAWTALATLTPSSSAVPTTFTALSGLLTPSSTSNSVRMRMTGSSYVFPFRNHVLYPYTWASSTQVQQNRAYFEYSLPSDWLEPNTVMIRRDDGQWLTLSDYKITPSYFCASRTYWGEVLVNYYRIPTVISVADTSNPTAPELAQTIDAATNAAYIVPAGVAGKILAVDDPRASAELLNYYEVRKYKLTPNTGNYGIQTIYNVY